ncbi:MAG: DUF4892 domain-containing protein [Acidobacteria bacterium]|nr:DUF4892 domain-containing protein [Acidobacteriota bacterium]MCG2812012.1 DUF4892 domain-containing protein [Candidatus Aminicenantes bacterium]
MRNKNKKMFWLLGMFLLATSITFAQEEDVEGSKDHPLVSRYPGSIIGYYKVTEFDEYILPLGKVDKELKLTKSQQLEGKVTQITYRAPEDRSTLEIYRNYELALKKAGFETLFTVTSKELGEGWDVPNIFEILKKLTLLKIIIGKSSSENLRDVLLHFAGKVPKKKGLIFCSA